MHKAKDLMNLFEYQKAIDLYKGHFKVVAPKISDMRNLAECYIQVNNTKDALEWMGKIASSDSSTADDIIKYAKLLKTEGQYDEAITQYKRYKASTPSKSAEVDQLVQACEKSKEWIANPRKIDITNVTYLNSANCDFGLMPANNFGYFFASDRNVISETPEKNYGWTGNPYLKIFYISGNENKEPTGNVKAVNDLNFNYHNGPAIYNEKQQITYFTRTNMVRVKKKPVNPDPTSWWERSTTTDYTNRLEIYSAQYANNQWTDIKPFPYNKPEEYSVGHPAISSDGQIMYFVSDVPGGFGETDIYYCKKEFNTWSTPKNAGSTINTAGREFFPFLDENGTLYFSSDGHPGMGGLDIFSSTGSESQWTEPKNLKSPVNSPKDDFSIYFTEAGKSGYFSSNRDGGKGEDDIYRFEVQTTKLVLAITTKEKLPDSTTVLLGDVDLTILNQADSSPLLYVVGPLGKYYATPVCNSEYKIKGMKQGYFTSYENVKVKCLLDQDTVYAELILNPISLGKPIVLRNIYYDFDKWYIRPDAAVELDKVVKIMVENPSIIVELGSHTDCRGSNKYNEVLSQKRAESAVEYIISRGIEKNRITAKGYGENVLLNKCKDGVKCTEEEHQFNRRTEFKVTGFIKGTGNVDIKSEKGTNIIVNPKPGTN